MNLLLTPSFYISRVTDLTPEWLWAHKIRGVLTDLDDTLAARTCSLPKQETIQWIAELKQQGIQICIVSNNHKKRTETFARPLEIGFVYNACKPFLWGLEAGLAVLGRKKEEVALIGDQIFTDIKAANRMGIRSILVEPIGPSGGLYVDWKRRKELPLRTELQKRIGPDGAIVTG